MTNYPEIVKKIHAEFLSAGDKILAEANKILSELSENEYQKAERLLKAGFTSTKEAVRFGSITLTNQQAKLISYYQQKYPLYKFITDDLVKQICKKYRLVNAPVSRFKGFVPDSKLKLIESANIAEIDQRPDQKGRNRR